MIVLSDLVDGLCTVEEQKKQTLEIINYISNKNFQTLEEHRKSIAPPPARARPSLPEPTAKAKPKDRISKAIEYSANNFKEAAINQTKWLASSGIDGFLTVTAIASFLANAFSTKEKAAKNFVIAFIAGYILILALIKFLELFCNFFG